MLAISIMIALNAAAAAALAWLRYAPSVAPVVIEVPSFSVQRAQWLAAHGHAVEIDADRNRVIITDYRGVCPRRTVEALHGYRVIDGVRFF